VRSDARDIPLDEFEQEMLERLLREHALRSTRDIAHPPTSAEPANGWGRRVGRHWRRRAIGVTAVALIASSSALAAVSLLGGSTAPVHLYGGKDLCPVGYEVAGQVSTKLFYPHNYPGHELSQGDVRCFASVQYARQAGYRLAPVPHGYTTVGPIYFARTAASVTRTCRTAQRKTRAVVYCPTRLPAPWIHPLINWDCPTADCGVPLLSLSGSFAAPSSFIASGVDVGEVTIWSASANQQRTYPYVLFQCDTPPRLVDHTRFRRHPAEWLRCSIFGSSSTVLRWHIGKQTYQISADGPPRLGHALVSYIAAHLIAVRRRSEQPPA
jgi:hypothetical protein